MSATSSPNHPANSGRGARADCRQRRAIVISGEKWFLDCVLDTGHDGEHTDIRGRRWESLQ